MLLDLMTPAGRATRRARTDDSLAEHLAANPLLGPAQLAHELGMSDRAVRRSLYRLVLQGRVQPVRVEGMFFDHTAYRTLTPRTFYRAIPEGDSE